MGLFDKLLSKEAQDKIRSTVKSAAQLAEEKLKETAETLQDKQSSMRSDQSQSAYSPSQVAKDNGETYIVSPDSSPRLIKKHCEPIIPFEGAVKSSVSRKKTCEYIEDLISLNLPGVTVKRGANISSDKYPGKKFVPVDLVLMKDSKPVLAVIVCNKNQYRLYGVINTMNACEEKGLPAIRFFKEFENKPSYVIGRIKTVARI